MSRRTSTTSATPEGTVHKRTKAISGLAVHKAEDGPINSCRASWWETQSGGGDHFMARALLLKALRPADFPPDWPSRFGGAGGAGVFFESPLPPPFLPFRF